MREEERTPVTHLHVGLVGGQAAPSEGGAPGGGSLGRAAVQLSRSAHSAVELMRTKNMQVAERYEQVCTQYLQEAEQMLVAATGDATGVLSYSQFCVLLEYAACGTLADQVYTYKV